MTASPTALPIARLRAFGCKVSTTIRHYPAATTPSARRWSYSVAPTGPSAPDVLTAWQQAGHHVAAGGERALTNHDEARDAAAELSRLADIVREQQDVTTPTGSDAEDYYQGTEDDQRQLRSHQL